jgi:integrase
MSTPTGRLLVTVLAALSQFERNLTVQRTIEGLASARARRRNGGRPKVDSRLIEKAVKLYKAQTYSVKEIVAITGVSQASLYRALTSESGELLGLYWSDIDEINRVIHVRRAVGLEYEEDDNGVFTNCKAEICGTKSKSSVRDVPTSAEVILTLNEWKQYLSNQPKIVEAIKNNGNKDLVFPNKYGKVRNYQGLRKQFDRFLDANGLAEFDITLHRLRHTYATIAREAGVGIDSISHLLGHKDIGVTSDVYVTPRKASLVQADDLVNKAINDLTNTAKKSPVSKNEITEKITVGSIKKAG